MPSSAVFEKYRKGKLRSGSKHGPKVTKRSQALAIFISERRKEKSGHYHGQRRRAR